MQVNYMFFLVALLTIPFCTSQIYTCKDKSILNSTYHLEATDGDVEKAYNEVASCATLKTENDEAGCCYLKVKIKNTAYDETYTLKGCHEVSIEQYIDEDLDFDDIVDSLEGNITKANSNIEVKKVNLDCSSKFIQFVGLSLLLLLL